MFLLIWKGWGIVVLVIAVVFLAIGIAAGDVVHANASLTGALMSIALVPGGAVCWFAGKRLDAQPPRVLVDPKTGAQVVLRRENTFFFVSVELWGPILAVIGVLLAIIELLIPQ